MKSPPSSRLIRWFAALTAVTYWLPLPAQTMAAVAEDRLKAAFVYNFILFTDWPADALGEGAPLNLCVNADSALRPALADLGGKLVKGRRILVQPFAVPGAVRNCQVVFLDSLDRDHWPRISKNLGSASVLTISDDDDIGHSGAVIALDLVDNRIAFDIDLKSARQARLVLSSKLLRLARTVQ